MPTSWSRDQPASGSGRDQPWLQRGTGQQMALSASPALLWELRKVGQPWPEAALEAGRGLGAAGVGEGAVTNHLSPLLASLRGGP